MEKIFEQALLYDFYGELLTKHQRTVYEDAVFNDMSLSEIADEQGISRQGVHDLIKRCDKILVDYENKLHLVERFSKAKEQVGQIVALTENIKKTQEGNLDINDYSERMGKIRELSQELMEDW